MQAWVDFGTLRLRAIGDDPLLGLGELPPSFRPAAEEALEAAERSAQRWVGRWKEHDPRLGVALRETAWQAGVSVQDLKKDFLRDAILLALHDARRLQVVQIGRDRAMRLESEIVLLQKQDLEALASGDSPEAVLRKLRGRHAGLHVFPPCQLLSPIQAAYGGYDLLQTYPTDLRPILFERWLFRRAVSLAEEYALREAGFDTLTPHPGWERVEVVDLDDAEQEVSAGRGSHVQDFDLVEALDNARRDEEELVGLLALATRVERETIALLQLFHVEEGLPVAEAVKRVAEERGVDVNTVHQTLSRLRRKLDEIGLSGLETRWR